MIDNALTSAKVLIVVSTDLEYIKSGWLEYEYETFYEDILSSRKSKSAQIISYTKNISTNALPRTLSRFQSFSINNTSVSQVCEFATKCLSKNDFVLKDDNLYKNVVGEDCVEKNLGKRSIYSSDYSNELNRLLLQSNNSKLSDAVALQYVFDHMSEEQQKNMYVLDLGSAYGYVSESRFSHLNNVNKVLCVDINEKVINRAKIIFAENDKLIFEVLDIESDTFKNDLIQLMNKHNIPYFSIVFSALTLHHLHNPQKVLRTVRNMMNDGSFIVLRGSDDGSKLCYPKSELMEQIIEHTMKARGVSDRHNGRKLFTQLFDARFKDIKMFSFMRDINQIEDEDRERLFEESFAYRINYFKKALDSDPNNSLARENYLWMENALEEFQEQFYQPNFWYCEYDYIGVAKK